MTDVQWMIANTQHQTNPNQGHCVVETDPASSPIVEIYYVAGGVYQPRYNGYPVEQIVVAFRNDTKDHFELIFETTGAEPDPLIIGRAEFENMNPANPVISAACTWTIENGSATDKGRITVKVYNHKVLGGEILWTLSEGTGSPGARLALAVKRQDAAISCP